MATSGACLREAGLPNVADKGSMLGIGEHMTEGMLKVSNTVTHVVGRHTARPDNSILMRVVTRTSRPLTMARQQKSK